MPAAAGGEIGEDRGVRRGHRQLVGTEAVDQQHPDPVDPVEVPGQPEHVGRARHAEHRT